MSRNQKMPAGGQNPALAVRARDAALTRISRTRRWMIAGAVALTAALAALASTLLPGKSFGAKGTATRSSSGPVATTAGTGTPQLPAPADAAQLGLQGPSGAPQPSAPEQPAPQPAPQANPQPAPAPAVVSGGS